MTVLRLLDGVTYAGRPVSGERSQALLAVLAQAQGRTVAESVLVAAVWGAGDEPANPPKALQVVVSRTRAQTAPDAVVRADGGYRLGPAPADVDACRLAGLVASAHRCERAGDLPAAREHATEAVTVESAASGDAPDPVEDLRATARAQRTDATAVLGRVSAAQGDHDEALALLLTVPDPDEPTLAALLRSEAAVHGAPTALARYEAHREVVRDRLGVDPGPALQRVHAELLAADNPVRAGVRFDATPLVGRDDDVRALRAMVRTSRVTSIVGPGGLGKTRLAHLLGREADQPVVHFVELVGVTSPDDVVGEVGSALGVRDSVSGRRVLTPEQRADVRGRIAHQLDQAPTLLILDNCEHVVEAVADLVAPLVAATRQVRVVTTTRAPLAIAAERVFALAQLDDEAATDLFRQRADAARPGVRLADDAVRRVVARLDGLPLAIELAAARVRAMSVDDIDRRLDDRFALLRGADRGAPDRHQTLLAVIDWSWNLLDERERRALSRLSVFTDGFTLAAAEAVVGPDALAAVESLASQSLLGVRDDDDGVRFRMLETVREFGRQRLLAAGEHAEARTALRDWATEVGAGALPGLYGRDQIATVRSISAEENNLADVLRAALADGDVGTAVVVVAALGTCWTIRGEHIRVISVLDAIEEVLADWEPPPHLVDATTRAAGVLVMNTAVTEMTQPAAARALLDRFGPQSDDAGTRALCRLLGMLDRDPELDLVSLADDLDRQVAMFALQWASHGLENASDPERAVEVSTRALELWEEEDGVWLQALQHTQLASLHAQLGRNAEARPHADAALGVLDALGADDDAVQLRSVLASAAIGEGRLDEASRLLDEMAARPSTGVWGGLTVHIVTRAELALAQGRTGRGLELFEGAVDQVRSLRYPGLVLEKGLEPWTLYVESAALSAYARHGTAGQGQDLYEGLVERAPRVLDPARRRTDYPVVGCVLFGLDAWTLHRQHRVGHGLRLLSLAHGFAYSRYSASMAWDRIVAEADELAPGALPRLVEGLDGRRGPDLLEEARAAVAGAGDGG